MIASKTAYPSAEEFYRRDKRILSAAQCFYRENPDWFEVPKTLGDLRRRIIKFHTTWDGLAADSIINKNWDDVEDLLKGAGYTFPNGWGNLHAVFVETTIHIEAPIFRAPAN